MTVRYLLVFLLGVGLSWWITILRWDNEVSTLNLSHLAQIKQINERGLADLKQANARANVANQSLAELDNRYTKELANALANNQKLVADIATGHRRVRIARADLASCQLTSHLDNAPSSMGVGEQVELTATAGSHILAIHAGIIADQAKLDYLQNYVKQLTAAHRQP